MAAMKGVTSRKNIQEFLIKCKGLLEEGIAEWGLFMIVFLVAFSGFGLGRLSVLEASRLPVSISEAPISDKPRGINRGGQYVASRGGATYSFPWCGGAANLKPENQVWFATEEAAQKAGYRPAKNCKGLVSKGSSTN